MLGETEKEKGKESELRLFRRLAVLGHAFLVPSSQRMGDGQWTRFLTNRLHHFNTNTSEFITVIINLRSRSAKCTQHRASQTTICHGVSSIAFTSSSSSSSSKARILGLHRDWNEVISNQHFDHYSPTASKTMLRRNGKQR